MNTFTIEALISNVLFLCEKNNTNPNQLGMQSGAGKSFVDNLKKGSFPTIDKVYKVATYFDCSVDYLLGRTDSPQGISQINTGNVGDNSNVNVHNEKKAADSDDTISELVTEFKNLSFSDKAKVINLVAELSSRGKEL